MKNQTTTCGRIVVTGIGCIAAPGRNIAEVEAAFRGESREPARSPFAGFGLDVPAFLAGEVLTEDGESRTVALARHATREALQGMALEGKVVGVCIGTTVASQINDIPFYENLRRTGIVDRAAVARYRNGNVAEAVAKAFGATGPRLTVCNACSSGADAIGVARSWLKAGLCDMVIAGGADELSRLAVCGFHALGVYSAERCRPFDANRAGLNLGEGAGILIIEKESHAVARGAKALCELVGYGAANDAHHLTAPHPEGMGLLTAISAVLHEMYDSSNPVINLAFVNTHGTSTLDNDRIEGTALAKMFPGPLPMVSTKGWTGHTLGAAGAIEAVFTIMGLRAGRIPGTAGLLSKDPTIPANVSPDARNVSGDLAFSTSLAFGGCNAALAFRRLP